MSNEFICLHCRHVWKARVAEYGDWKRRKCPNCGKRNTVEKDFYDKAVEEFANSLRTSPPPHPPTKPAISATYRLLVKMFPDSSPVKVLLDINKAARKRVRESASKQNQD